MAIRLCKTALVASAAFYLLLVVFNNLTDYGSNFLFVQHVLSMDTTFEGNRAMWRAIDSPLVYHAFYGGIIAWEAVSMGLLAWGSWMLWSHRKASLRDFNREKKWAIIGLTVSMLQWLVAFITVGGEWFLMWQSDIWNGEDAAFRMFACMGIILLFLISPDEEISLQA